MSSNLPRAGESAGRKAAIREVAPRHSQELLPSSLPLPKPTRDISASNRSHSILHPPQPHSEHYLKEDYKLQKQANIIYTRQFKTLAKLMGNQGLDFEEVRRRVENLLFHEQSPHSENDLKFKVEMLERQLGRKEDHRSASQHIGSLKAMETQINRKNKIITEFNGSIRKEHYEEQYKEWQDELNAKQKSLLSMEEQIQEARIKSASQIGTLEEEIIKRNQNVQKMTFQLNTLKRKYQVALEEGERTKKRQRQLAAHLQAETRASYQGIAYSISSLLKQLLTRDNQMSEITVLKQQAEQERQRAEEQLRQLNHQYECKEVVVTQLKAKLDYTQTIGHRLSQEIQQLKEQNQQHSQRERDLMTNIDLFNQIQYQGIHYTVAALVEKLTLKDAECLEVRQRQSALQEERERLQGEVIICRRKVESSQAVVSQTKASASYFQVMATRQQEELKQLKEQGQSIRKEEERLKRELQGQQVLNAELKANIEYYQKASQRQILQLTQLSQENQSYRNKHQELQSRVESYNKIDYQGTTHDTASLILLLQRREKELTDTLGHQKLFQEEGEHLKTLISNYQEDRQSHSNTLKEMQLKLKNYESLKNEHEEQAGRWRQQLSDVEKEKTALQKQADIYLKRGNQLQERQSLNSQENKSIYLELQRLKQATQAAQQQVAQLHIQKQTNQLTITHLQQNLQQQSIKYSEIMKNFATMQDKLLEEVEARNRVQNKLAQHEEVVNSQMGEHRTMVENYEEREGQFKRERGELDERIRTLEVQLQVRTNEMMELKIRIDGSSVRQASLMKEIQVGINQNTMLQQQISRLRQQIERHDSQLGEYEQKVQAVDQYSHKLTSLEQQVEDMHHLQQEIISLRLNITHQHQQLQAMPHLQNKIQQLQVQAAGKQEQEHQLRVMLDEASQKQQHLESQAEHQGLQLDQLRAELHQQRHNFSVEKEQMSHNIEVVNEQYEVQKRRVEEQREMRGQVEQQLAEFLLRYKQLEVTRSMAEQEMVSSRQNYVVGEQMVAEVQKLREAERIQWNEEKMELTQQVQKLRQQIVLKESELNRIVQTVRGEHQELRYSLQQRIANLQQEHLKVQTQKQELTTQILLLTTQKEQSAKGQSERPSLGNQLQECQFNYYQAQKPPNPINEGTIEGTEELYRRMELLQAKVEELQSRQQKSAVSGDETPTEEDHLRVLVKRLQQNNQRAERQMQRLKQEYILRLQTENQCLRLKQVNLGGQIMKVQEMLQNNKTTIVQLTSREETSRYEIEVLRQQLINKQTISQDIRSKDSSDEVFIILKQNYEVIQKQLEGKNKGLVEQMGQLQTEVQQIRQQHKEFQLRSNLNQQQYERQAEKLKEQVNNYEEKEGKMNQQILEFSAIAGEIDFMRERMMSIQKECDQHGQTKKELQLKNIELQRLNQQLSSRLKELQREEEHRILSKLSKKSNVSGRQSSKKEDQGSEQPSSDGELSRKILNYDPSKISGQQSKFMTHMAFEGSKIQMSKQAAQGNEFQENNQHLEIKQMRNEESILSKALQQKQKSATSSFKKIPDRKSQTSKKELSKKNASEREVPIQTQIHLKSRTSHAYSSPSQKHYSQYSGQSIAGHFRKEIEIVSSQHQRIIVTKEEEVQTIQENQKKEEYLPQQSSKKSIHQPHQNQTTQHFQTQQLHPSPPPPQPFQKSVSPPVSPVYMARPSIIERLQQNAPRQSQSRSNSRNRVTISYGQPSAQLRPNTSKVIYQDKSQLSKKSSQINSMVRPSNPINDISPVKYKQSQMMNSPNNSLQQSSFRHQSKLIRQSFVRPAPEKVQSESIINRIAHQNEGISYEAIKKPLFRQGPPSYIPPQMQNNRPVQLAFNAVRSGQSQTYFQQVSPNLSPKTIYKAQEPLQRTFQTTPNQVKRATVVQEQVKRVGVNQELVRKSQVAVQPLRSVDADATTPKLTMKKVASGRKMNSGMGNSMTFGGRTQSPLDNDDISSSSDSGIEVLQYDWTAPCCTNES